MRCGNEDINYRICSCTMTLSGFNFTAPGSFSRTGKWYRCLDRRSDELCKSTWNLFRTALLSDNNFILCPQLRSFDDRASNVVKRKPFFSVKFLKRSRWIAIQFLLLAVNFTQNEYVSSIRFSARTHRYIYILNLHFPLWIFAASQII